MYHILIPLSDLIKLHYGLSLNQKKASRLCQCEEGILDEEQIGNGSLLRFTCSQLMLFSVIMEPLCKFAKMAAFNLCPLNALLFF